VAWLEHYLTNIPEVSSMIVSHDSGAPRVAAARARHALDACIARTHDGGAARGDCCCAGPVLYAQAADAVGCARAGFLDNVCTDIIHYEEKKLVHYPGNLSEFVKARCRSLLIEFADVDRDLVFTHRMAGSSKLRYEV